MQQLQWWGMPLKIFRKFSKTDALKLLLRLLLAIHTTITSFVQSHKDTCMGTQTRGHDSQHNDG